MGTLTPGATYIYEKDGHRIYAREAGSLDRRLIGEVMNSDSQQLVDTQTWTQVLKAADTNATLKDAIQRVLIIYQLSQSNG